MIPLPYRAKLAGWALTLLGCALLAAWLFMDFRVTAPVLAIVSSYFNIKWFTVFSTNVADEITMLIMLAGLFILSFSSEKTEHLHYAGLRTKALFMAVIANMAMLVVFILFFFGQAFIVVILFNVYLLLAMYIGIFAYLRRKHSSTGLR